MCQQLSSADVFVPRLSHVFHLFTWSIWSFICCSGHRRFAGPCCLVILIAAWTKKILCSSCSRKSELRTFYISGGHAFTYLLPMDVCHRVVGQSPSPTRVLTFGMTRAFNQPVALMFLFFIFLSSLVFSGASDVRHSIPWSLCASIGSQGFLVSDGIRSQNLFIRSRTLWNAFYMCTSICAHIVCRIAFRNSSILGLSQV